jgi:hypothetical protein
MPYDNPLALLAVLGLISFTVTSYFNYRIYRRLMADGETTLEYIFLRKEIETALEVLIASIIIFLLSSLITVVAVETQMLVLSQAIRVGTSILFIAYTGFFIALDLYTRPEKP